MVFMFKSFAYRQMSVWNIVPLMIVLIFIFDVFLACDMLNISVFILMRIYHGIILTILTLSCQETGAIGKLCIFTR